MNGNNIYIEILNQDEYRAKIENIQEINKKQKSKDIPENEPFFYESYKKADKIIAEIILMMQNYQKENEKDDNYRTKFQGMGNNIILFSGERGQGKTSAMQSYAISLRRDSNECGGKKIKEKNYYFHVLDSIDPSSLDTGESLPRILVSRLFYDIKKLTENTESSHKRDFYRENGEIIDLFQKCYENIDYIRKKQDVKQDYQNDLETLAHLGSSANLKRNLYLLIKKYLKIKGAYGEGNERNSYLVIPIDDADLAVKEIFEVCEDIRNYFFVPNVIVLMAANFEQLRTVVFQSYLQQFNSMVSIKSIHFEDDCNQMTARYLEKMFPIGHRIILPDINAVIREDFSALEVKYLSEEGKSLLFKKKKNDEKDSDDFQNQLMRELYQKTGIVLIKREEIHPFLPHTLRELTHFVKMLHDMESFEWKDIFREGEYKKLKSNLLVIKEYFLDYWCKSHLNFSQQKLMIQLEEANFQIPVIVKLLNEYIESKEKQYFVGKNTEEDTEKDTYFDIIHDIVQKKLMDETILQEAIYLYYTIRLNEWFIKAIVEFQDHNQSDEEKQKEKQIEKIVKFLGGVINKNDDKYSFKIDEGEFKILYGESLYKDIEWFLKKYKELDRSEDSSLIELNYFKVILVLIVAEWESGDKNDEEEVIKSSESDNIDKEIYNYDYLINTIIFLANWEVQDLMEKRIKMLDISKTIVPEAIFNSILENFIYKTIKKIDYLETDMKLGELEEWFREYKISELYYSAEENVNSFIREYAEFLKNLIKKVKNILNNVTGDIVKEELTILGREKFLKKEIVKKIQTYQLKELLMQKVTELLEQENKIMEKITELQNREIADYDKKKAEEFFDEASNIINKY